MATKYKVRNHTLHKVIIDGYSGKTTQPYRPGATVELTDAEALRYQHLVEPITTKGSK